MSMAATLDPTHTTSHDRAERLRVDHIDSTDRTCAIWMHIAGSPLAWGLIGLLAPVAPIVLWVLRKDNSPFADDHGREVINLMLTGLIFTVILGLIPIVGWLALLVWYIVAIIGSIRGAVACSNNEYFRYPMLLRFV